MRRIRTDDELIEQYLVGTREDAERAFEALMTRHGPMVMGICRQVLNRHQDAEDAFQATFFELARRAGTIRDRKVLLSWLYEVAYRISLRMKYRGRPRPAPPGSVREGSPAAAEHAAVRSELRLHLRAAVDRLPEKYRVLVEQCYLEGKSYEELARLLDRPVGTIKGWLARARGMLRERLSGTALEPEGIPIRSRAARRA